MTRMRATKFKSEQITSEEYETFDRTLLKRLNSFNRFDRPSSRKQRREQALAEARQLSSDQLLSLAKTATQQVDGIRRRNRIGNPFLWIYLVLPAAFGLLTLIHKSIPFNINMIGSVIMWVALCTPCALMWYGYAAEPTRLYTALCNLIAERPEPCFLGPALDLLRWSSISINAPRHLERKALASAIEQMVREMEPGDYANLTARQKETLLRFLKEPLDHLELSLALLEILSTVSDKSAMERVAYLAHDEAATPRQKQVRQAARQCFASMQRVHAGEQQAQMLLRASDADTVAAPDMLLRPAADMEADAAPDQLLRAAASHTQNSDL